VFRAARLIPELLSSVRLGKKTPGRLRSPEPRSASPARGQTRAVAYQAPSLFTPCALADVGHGAEIAGFLPPLVLSHRWCFTSQFTPGPVPPGPHGRS